MPDAPTKPDAVALFVAFAKIGLTSFGGGLSGWIMQDLVRRRRWMSEDDFLAGLAMSQAVPGVNVVNIAIWMGYRLAGSWGALAATAGIVLPPMVVVSLFAAGYGWLAQFTITERATEGAVAGSIGLMLAMGARVGRRSLARLGTALVMGGVLLAVGWFDLPILLVLAVAVPISVGLAWLREPRRG